MNLFIIGNGFDLAHGLRTSYSDFLSDLHEKIRLEPNGYPDLVYTKRSRANKLILDERNISSVNSYFSNDFLRLLYKSGIVGNNWSDIEYLYFKLLISLIDNNVNNELYKSQLSYNDVKRLNDEFSHIRKYLELYLAGEQQKFSRTEFFQRLFSTFKDTDTIFLNFNYTDTVKRYLEDSQLSDHIHIHGELNCEENPIIFGFAANDNESKKLVDQDDNEFMKNIKKINYKLTDNEFRLKTRMNDSKFIDVLILGHSCGISDKHILNQIFNHEKVQSISKLYYGGPKGYLQTTINIDRIIDDYSKQDINSKSFHKLRNLPSCSPFLQSNSECVEIIRFNKFVDSYYGLYKEKERNLGEQFVRIDQL